MARSNGNEQSLAAAFVTVINAPAAHPDWIGIRQRVQIRRGCVVWGNPCRVYVGDDFARIVQVVSGQESDCWIECSRAEWDKLAARAEAAAKGAQ